MEHLLVPIEVSSAALNAVQYAFRISQVIGAPITFLFRQEPNTAAAPLSPAFYASEGRWKNRDAQRQQLHNLLSHMYQSLHGGENAPAQSYSVYEYVNGYEFLDFVRNCPSSLFITGSQQAHNNPMLNLLQLAQIHCPILSVPAQAAFQRIGTVTLVTDFNEAQDKASLQALFQIAGIFSARLHLVDVGHQRSEPRLFRQAVKQLGLADLLDSLPHTYHWTFRKDLLQELDSFLKESNTDLLALSQELRSHWNKQGFGREKTFSCPLLVLPGDQEKVGIPTHTTSTFKASVLSA
jgi:hypothetical protein